MTMSKYTPLSAFDGRRVERGRGTDKIDSSLGKFVPPKRVIKSSESRGTRVKSASAETAYTLRMLTVSIMRAFLQ